MSPAERARLANMALAEIGQPECVEAVGDNCRWPPWVPEAYKAQMLVFYRQNPHAKTICRDHTLPEKFNDCRRVTVAEALLGHTCGAP